LSAARCVGRFHVAQDSLTKTRHHCQQNKFLHTIRSLAIAKKRGLLKYNFGELNAFQTKTIENNLQN
jgi:hypothetical protein